MFQQDEHHDPTLPAIEEIINTMRVEQPEQPERLEGTLHWAAGVIDSVAGQPVDIERTLATAQELSDANAPDVSAQLRPASSSETPTDPGARSAGDPDEAGPSDQEVREFIDWFVQFLPDPASCPAGESPAADRAMIFCKTLADLASVLAILANVVTGPISLSIQQTAKDLRAPLVATGVELSLAAAKEMAGGTLTAELTGQRVADAILGFASPGSCELKVTAFALRLTGTIACLAAGVRPVALHTQCSCYPDLWSDTGSAAIGS